MPLATTERQTIDVGPAARMCGVSVASAYREIREKRTLACIPVIKVGRRITVPLAGLRRVLGQDEDYAENSEADCYA